MSEMATKMAMLLLLWLMLFPAAIHAKGLKEGMHFLTARKLLFNSAWRPINVHEADNYAYIGIENQLVEAHINEVESCAIDKPVCLFNYKKGHQCLQVFTFGEEIKDMHVYRWTYGCSDK